MGKRLFTLEVKLLHGRGRRFPQTKKGGITRTIAIRGEHKLEKLHDAIFSAFDRFDTHLYQFEFGAGPHDRDAVIYEIDYEPDPFANRGGFVEDTRIGDLNLEVGAKFWYRFDFGDDWYHEITVIDIGEPEPKTRYPKVVDRAGKSPPQYPSVI
jgi:hypothetical protein